MCGFVGFLGGNYELGEAETILHAMTDSISHRGPNDSGVWFDPNQQVGLAHRRLSIVDLSPAGHQPMFSKSSRYVIAFNGEIYNHLLLRQELQNDDWRGHSDTETLLAGFERWGIRHTIERTVGMFAFAVWDKKDQVLTLGRDRLGEKPLYYGWQQNSFMFGSELKVFNHHPAFVGKINRDNLALLMRYSTIPAPYCIWDNVHKLPPGCLLTVSHHQREPQIVNYWSPKECIEQSLSDSFVGSPAEAVDALENILHDAIGMQMMADVPVGAFLSGGVDSSTIVALMQARSSRPVKSFSIGFNEEQYNEAVHAKAVANHLGTEHTELYVKPKDALDVIPQLARLYDEPFADSSQIPTFLVSQLAKQHVTVSLSGDGGDELFCGYNRYIMVNRLWNKLSRMPVGLRRTVAKCITSVPPARLTQATRLLPNRFKMVNMGEKLHKGARVMASRTSHALYQAVVSHWDDPASLVLDATEPQTLINNPGMQLNSVSDIERMMALDMCTYLPDDILVKVDRAAMGVSLETRVPFLDHRVVSFAWSLPLEYKLSKNVGKWVLREVLYKHVPKKLIERPKMGFGVPIDSWLRGPLRDWAENLLDEQRLKQEGIFNHQLIKAKWKEHLSGRSNWQYLLWDVLMFQDWFALNKGI